MQVFQLHQADGHPKVAMHLLADGQLEVLGTAPNGVEVQSTGLRTGDYTQVLIPVYVKDRNLRLASGVSGAASSVRGNGSASAGYLSPSQYVSQTRHQRSSLLPVSDTAGGGADKTGDPGQPEASGQAEKAQENGGQQTVFQAGDRVEAQCLASESGMKLNGKVAIVSEDLEDKGRFKVRLAPDEVFNVKPANLRRRSPAPPDSGKRGFAIGSAALVSLALFSAFTHVADVTNVNILDVWVFTGLLLGAIMLYALAAWTKKSVGMTDNDMVKEVPAPSHMAAENDDLDGIVERDRTDGKVTFFFAKADFVRNFQPSESCKSLPCFQELRRQGALEEVRISKNEALQGKLVQHQASVVSHRWETPKVPDPDGKQLEDISRYLSEKRLVKLMWEDYWCIPQGKRTSAENKYFRWIMEHMDFLYLGCPDVLAIIDMSSQSRFWTQFEAWMAMQSCSQDGLQPAPKDKRRCQISCIHSAEPGKDDKKMMELWARREPAEAHELLKARDVAVTNQTDKDLWLRLIFELDEAVKSAFTLSQAKDLHEQGEMAEHLEKAGFTSTQLQEAGYNSTQLKEAGYSAEELREAGYSAKELDEAGYSAKAILEAGYSAKHLKAGYSAEALREAGYDARSILRAGYSAKAIREAGYSIQALRRAGGYSREAILKAGYSVEELLEADCGGVPAILEAGYSVKELLEVGISVKELRENGWIQ